MTSPLSRAEEVRARLTPDSLDVIGSRLEAMRDRGAVSSDEIPQLFLDACALCDTLWSIFPALSKAEGDLEEARKALRLAEPELAHCVDMAEDGGPWLALNAARVALTPGEVNHDQA